MIRDEQWLLEEKYFGKETAAFVADKHRLASGEPVAYVIGWQPFLGLKIYLDSKPLIPRPETEWWVEELIAVMRKVWPNKVRRSEDFSKGGNEFRFLDLCAGSGAVGCAALAKLQDAYVYFGEIDPEHEATILKNVRENGLDEPRADIRIGDLFEPFDNLKFDVIAANPPYIPTDRTLPASVTNYEPTRALRAGKGGLDVIRRIAKELPKYLAEKGMAWIECDSATAEAAAALFRSQNFHVEIRTDQYGKPRVLVVSFP